jgi:hypothetical protein
MGKYKDWSNGVVEYWSDGKRKSDLRVLKNKNRGYQQLRVRKKET